MFLARKITRAKWPNKAKWSDKTELSADEIPADAVTADLRTRDNALSFWQCGAGTQIEVEDAALAIAAAGDRIDRLDLVWFADEELQNDGQTFRNTPGRTPIPELIRLHVDVHRLDYVRLGKVAHRVVDAIEGGQYVRLTKARVTELLTEAVEQARVDPADLPGNIRVEVAESEGTGKERNDG